MVKIRFETGHTVDFQGNPTQADIDEVAKSLQIQKPVEEKSFISSTEPTYKASVAGGVSDIPKNVAKTFANIPSSARNLTRESIAPVNPFDIKSPTNIGANISGSAFALKDIVSNRGVFGGAKDIAGGVLDTAKKGVDIYKGIGKSIYNKLESDVQNKGSISGGVGSSIADVAIATSKKGIEDPLLIPSMIYAPSKVRGTGLITDNISTLARPVINTTKKTTGLALDMTKKGATTATEAISNKIVTPVRQAQAIDQLEQTYKDIGSGTTIGKKKTDKLISKTETLNKAGTTGKTPMRTLAEEGIIPERTGTKLNTFDQAAQYREKITPLREANKTALEEVGLSTAPVDLDSLKIDAINYAKTPANINSGRFASMEKDIIKEFDLLKTYYPTGKVPLSIIDDIKSARWENVFKNKSLIEADVLKKDSEYSIAKALQKRIESIAEQAGNPEVAQLNREIGDRLEAAKYLEDLNGKTIKGGRAMKYVTTAIGSSVGQSLPGKIVGALGGNIVGEMIIANNVANPIKRLILRNLRAKDPQAYTNTINWLNKQNLDRETRLLLPEASATYVSPTTQAPTSQMIVTGGKTPPSTFAQAQKRASGLPEYGGLYEYNQAKETTQKAVGRSILPKANANKGTSVKRPPIVPANARIEDLSQSKSPTSQQTNPAISNVTNISKSITVPKGSSIDQTRKIVNNHLESTLMAISDTPTFDVIQANPKAFYRQQIQDIAMGLKAENPKYARLSNSITSIDANKIDSFEDLANKIREKLNKKTLMETITGKGIPNRQGGFIKNPLANEKLIRGVSDTGTTKASGVNLYGKGLYLTDDAGVAKHYGNKIENHIVSGNILDATKPLTKKDFTTIIQGIEKRLNTDLSEYKNFYLNDFPNDLKIRHIIDELESHTGDKPIKAWAKNNGMDTPDNSMSDTASLVNDVLKDQKVVGLKYSTDDIEDLYDKGMGGKNAYVIFDSKALQKTNPLIQEAKKYKSAEEFVKAQGESLFHGGTKIDKVGNMNNRWKAFYMTDSADYAKNYGGKNSVLNDMVLDKNAKIADLRNPSDKLLNDIKQIIEPKPTGNVRKIEKPDGTILELPEMTGGKINRIHSTDEILKGIKKEGELNAYYAEMPEVKEALKELGYDGMITTESAYGSNYGVWNKNVIKTKSQLEDIWKQANKSALPKPKK